MSKGDIKWWFEPGDGQKIGWMMPGHIQSALQYLYGERAPGAAFAAEIGVSHSTVYRWSSGLAPMPKLPALYLHGKTTCGQRRADVKPLFAPWLPECYSANGRQMPDDPRWARIRRNMKAVADFAAGGPLPRDVPGTDAFKQRYVVSR